MDAAAINLLKHIKYLIQPVLKKMPNDATNVHAAILVSMAAEISKGMGWSRERFLACAKGAAHGVYEEEKTPLTTTGESYTVSPGGILLP